MRLKKAIIQFLDEAESVTWTVSFEPATDKKAGHNSERLLVSVNDGFRQSRGIREGRQLIAKTFALQMIATAKKQFLTSKTSSDATPKSNS